MLWYSDGSIQVAANGQVAAGTGTAFLRNVRVGDGLTIAGSTSLHEVTNIASDLQLTFAPPYTGAAGAGKTYRIAPIQGYVKEAADLLRQFTQQFGAIASNQNLSALAVAVGGANKGLMFTAPSAIGTFDLTAQARVFLAAASIAQQRTAMGLGSAALLTAVEGLQDRTLGRVQTIGNLGYGSPIISTEVNANAYTTEGFYLSPNTGLVNFPGGFTSRIFVRVLERSSYITQEMLNPSTGAFAYRGGTSHANMAAAPWRVSWSNQDFALQPTSYTDRVGDVLVNSSFGLGRPPVPINNLNATELYVNGFLAIPADAVGNNFTNRLAGISLSWAESERSQILMEPATETMRLRFRYSSTAGVWKPDRDVWHSGNLVKMSATFETTIGAVMINGAYGMGARIAPVMSNNNNNHIYGGIYGGPGVNGVNFPGSTAYGATLIMSRGANITRFNTFFSVNAEEVFVSGSADSGTSWTAPVRMWHSGNLTPNKLEERTNATLGAAGGAGNGQMYLSSNTARGRRPVYSDGSNWRYLEDNAVVS